MLSIAQFIKVVVNIFTGPEGCGVGGRGGHTMNWREGGGRAERDVKR